MIQELLSMVEGRKTCIEEGILDGSSPFSSSTPVTSPVSSPSPVPEQNLKCPRCDSSNTKFCYYNNYNLTQPRYFCKTCRRYWTKGGALRNVPIGGGCRRGRPSPNLAAFRAGSSKGKPAPANSGGNQAQNQEQPACPVLWASPYSSQLLALLRASQLQNPNPNHNNMRVKDEGMMAEQSNLGQLPYDSMWRSGGQYQHTQPTSNPNIEFIQRLRSSPASYYSEQMPPVMNNVGTTSMATSNGTGSILQQPGGDFGYWNPGVASWVDLNRTNGAYP